ncbi:MAG: hypothetical protein ABJO01_14005 [Parasphingorhabdus sp.]|uniref:hypothetical protein n=1 Tax=Parasphingorhabdus sp. TaxID=2709688 RepID=UPI0032993791
MNYLRPAAQLSDKVQWRYWLAVLLLAVLHSSANAQQKIDDSGVRGATVLAYARIAKPFRVAPDNFVARPRRRGEKLADISVQTCNAETGQQIDACVLMIYELQ